MAKARFFSVFLKFILPLLALFLAAGVFSCKSTPSAPEPEVSVAESETPTQGSDAVPASDASQSPDQSPDPVQDTESANAEAPDTSPAVDSQAPDSDPPTEATDSDVSSDPEEPAESESAPPAEAEVPPAEPSPTSQPAVVVEPAELEPATEPVQPPPQQAQQQAQQQQAPSTPQQTTQEQTPQQQSMPQQTTQQQSTTQTPPEPPPFLRPAEPVIPQQERQPLPVPLNPLPDLPARVFPEGDVEQISFSRVVHVVVGQVLEIPFRGTGWVYLGELRSRRGISYNTRRLDVEGNFTLGQSFIFTAEAVGTYVLKFYRQDFILDYIINDYVQVIVGETEDSGSGRPGYPVDRSRVVAEPRWPLTSPGGEPRRADQSDSASGTAGASPAVSAPASQSAAPSQPGSASAAQPQAAPPSAGGSVQAAPATAPSSVPAPTTSSAPAAQSPPPASGISSGSTQAATNDAAPQSTTSQGIPGISPDASPDEYIRAAKQEFDAGRMESALSILDAMKQRYPSGTDEAWWLYGQILEANSSSRDIRQALEYYRRLVREYPQSARVADAQRRIAYLERFYFNIR